MQEIMIIVIIKKYIKLKIQARIFIEILRNINTCEYPYYFTNSYLRDNFIFEIKNHILIINNEKLKIFATISSLILIQVI